MKNKNWVEDKWIRSVLSNDEYSSDEELVKYFIEEGKMSEKEAKGYVAKRNYYLCNIVLDNGEIYKPTL